MAKKPPVAKARTIKTKIKTKAKTKAKTKTKVATKIQAKTRAKKQGCSLCSKKGHNSRSCPSYEWVEPKQTKPRQKSKQTKKPTTKKPTAKKPTAKKPTAKKPTAKKSGNGNGNGNETGAAMKILWESMDPQERIARLHHYKQEKTDELANLDLFLQGN
jgi:hypothetical protein